MWIGLLLSSSFGLRGVGAARYLCLLFSGRYISRSTSTNTYPLDLTTVRLNWGRTTEKAVTRSTGGYGALKPGLQSDTSPRDGRCNCHTAILLITPSTLFPFTTLFLEVFPRSLSFEIPWRHLRYWYPSFTMAKGLFGALKGIDAFGKVCNHPHVGLVDVH